MIKTKILSFGSYLPAKVVTNEEISKTVDTSDEWIFTRTGIKQRHIAAENEYTSDLAYEAAKDALANAGVSADSLDAVLVATISPDFTFPGVATQVHERLGCSSECFAYDVEAACAGLLTLMHTAKSHIESGSLRRILLIGAECFSKFIDWTDRATCVLFGDGASAVLLEAGDSSDKPYPELIDVKLWTDGTKGKYLKSTGGVCTTRTAGFIYMNGQQVFKNAVINMATSVEELLTKNGLTTKDLSFLVPHQANARIMQAVAERLSLEDSKVISTVRTQANTSAASLILALHHHQKQNLVKKGDLVGLTAIGAGLTWGSALVKW